MLTYELAHQIWLYDRDSGRFTWKIRASGHAAVGDRAGYWDGRYWRLRYKKKNYKASRVAWLMVKGVWPTNLIDHRNRDKADDSFSNLREATYSENAINSPVKKTNKLGVRGVHKGPYSYQVQIASNGKRRRIGCFKTLEEAQAAYSAEAERLHGQFTAN